jgi:hypothetical protein
MTLIIEDVKKALAIEPSNLAFDGELYVNINSAKSILIQLGVEELNISIDETTSWPVFDSDVVGELAQHYMVLKVKSIFDPTASETIQRTFSEGMVSIESRIVHELDEEAADV